MKTLHTDYRVETKWPTCGKKTWRWLPEDEGLSIKQARQIKKNKHEWPGQQARIVRTMESVVK